MLTLGESLESGDVELDGLTRRHVAPRSRSPVAVGIPVRPGRRTCDVRHRRSDDASASTAAFGPNEPSASRTLATRGDVVTVAAGTAAERLVITRCRFALVAYQPDVDHACGPGSEPAVASLTAHEAAAADTIAHRAWRGSADHVTTRSRQGAALRSRCPLVHEQQAIAEVLGALDDKIAANMDLVATAERLARRPVWGRHRRRRPPGRVAWRNVAEFHNRLRVPRSAQRASSARGCRRLLRCRRRRWPCRQGVAR